MTERLLTARELADVVGVTPATILRWTRHGDGPPAARLPSGQLRYPEEAFIAWLAARTTPRADNAATRSTTNGVALAASHTPRVRSPVRHDPIALSAIGTPPREEH